MYERIEKLLREVIEDEDIVITPDSLLVEDLGLSSLEAINMVATFEDEFGIEIPDRVIPTLHTVQDIVSYIENNRDA